MIRRRIVRHEFIMSEAEFELFTAMCDPDKFAYGYVVSGNWRDGNEEVKVTMKEDTLYEVERVINHYICDFETDYEGELRDITTEEWEFYYDVKKLFEELMFSEEEEEEE